MCLSEVELKKESISISEAPVTGLSFFIEDK